MVELDENARATYARLHGEMVDAVLGGGDLERLAALAAAEARGTVAIVVPAGGLAVAAPAAAPTALAALRRYVGQRLAGEPVPVPDGLVLELPVRIGSSVAGLVLLLDAPSADDAGDLLHLVATTTVVAMALEAAPDDRRRVGEALMTDLLDGADRIDILGRARRAGADLSRGAVAACALDARGYGHRVRAAILDAFPTALVLQREQRVDALLPHADEAGALRLAGRLEPVATLALSPHEPDPERLDRALREAALAATLLRRAPATVAQAVDGTYRLLLRLASESPGELARFHRATVGVIADHDAEHGTTILETLIAYLENDCNMNATAAAIYAHRHTVAYRLERVRDLTGLDPLRREGREHLGLAIKADALMAA